jgi:hypothetical protein
LKKNTRHDRARCVICNQVSHGDVETDLGDATYKTFREVSYGSSGVPAFLCYDCSSSISEVKSEFDMEDDEYGWDNHGDIFA